MRKVISISEQLHGVHEGKPLHALAEANYDEATGELVVALWMSNTPKARTEVRTKVTLDEAVEAAKDVFHSWVRKLVKEGAVQIEGA